MLLMAMDVVWTMIDTAIQLNADASRPEAGDIDLG